jgi:hypothetical protein
LNFHLFLKNDFKVLFTFFAGKNGEKTRRGRMGQYNEVEDRLRPEQPFFHEQTNKKK